MYDQNLSIDGFKNIRNLKMFNVLNYLHYYPYIHRMDQQTFFILNLNRNGKITY